LKKILLSSPRSGGLILARRFNAETKEPRDFVAERRLKSRPIQSTGGKTPV
jgi:hypothetical protein